ncbi:MAG: non-ribosomal peptide synthetase [Gemmatimonadaceae bacterium]
MTIAPAPRREADTYRLTTMQQGMVTTSVLQPDTSLNVWHIILELGEAVHVEAMRFAWAQLLERHDALRSRVRSDNPMLQLVEPFVELQFRLLDWTRRTREEQERAFLEFLEADRRSGMDIFRAPTFRVAVVQWTESEWRLVWTLHHAFLDGASVSVLLVELFHLYDERRQGRTPALEPASQFGQYIRWAERQEPARTEAHWADYLAGATPTPLPFSRRPSSFRAQSYRERERPVGASVEAALRACAASIQVTPNTVLQAAWGLVLAHHARTEDVLFASVRSGRQAPLDGITRMVGPLIFNIPVRVRVDWRLGTREWLERLRVEQTALPERETAPLVAWQQRLTGRSSELLASSLVVFDSQSTGRRFASALGVHGRKVRILRQPGFDVSVAGTYGEDRRLSVRLNFYEDALRSDEADIVLSHIVSAMEQLVALPHKRVEDVRLANAAEGQRVLAWSRRAGALAADTRIVPLSTRIAEWAQSTPSALAVESAGVMVTYAELDARANQVAHLLRRRGVGRGTIVGAALERDAGAVIALLGVLKAGGTYLPLDLDYPVDRLRHMLTDSGARTVVLSSSESLPDGLEMTADCIDLRRGRGEIDAAPTSPVDGGPQLEDAAYLMYTSGSTGVPKGVLVTHQSIMWLFRVFRASMDPRPHDVWSAIHSFSFDFSILEIWGALATGGRVVIASKELMRSPAEVWTLVRTSGVTIFGQTPSFFYHLMREALSQAQPENRSAMPAPAIRLVVFGGDALSGAKMSPWIECMGTDLPRLLNVYGPTETTVFVTTTWVDGNTRESGPSGIGRPLDDVDAFVIDDRGDLAAIGVPGELYIGGACVSLGYWRRGALTASRFVPNPFSSLPGERLYRSGDLARYDVVGRLEYLGRLDRQMKIRGFRIEPGEVEAAISTDPRVDEVCVMARANEREEPTLVAYVASAALAEDAHGQRLPTAFADDLRRCICAQLPQHCVPAAFVVVSRVPLTQNGKVDFARLPAPPTSPADAESIDAPRTPVEELIVALWEEVLERAPVRAHDHFFELGGHSILATRAAARLEEVSGVHVPLNSFFTFPVLADFAREISRDAEACRELTKFGVAVSQVAAHLANDGRAAGLGSGEAQAHD